MPKPPKRVKPEPGIAVFQRSYKRPDGSRGVTSTWTVRVWVRGTEHKFATKFRDQSAAVRWGLEQRTKLERQAAGIESFDDTLETSLAELAAEYEQHMKALGRDDEHVTRTLGRLREMLKGYRSLADLTPPRIRARLGEIATSTADTAFGPRARGPRTRNRYRSALHGFFDWLVKDDRWPRNPVAGVEVLRETGAKVWRALRLEEAEALLVTVPRLDRRVLYTVTIMSGLRRSDVEGLLWRDVDLERGVMTLRDVAEKNRRGSVLLLRPRTVELLRELRAGRAERRPGCVPMSRPKVVPGWQAHEPVFGSPPGNDTLRADLARALPNGERFDEVAFHSLRRTTNTGLKDLGFSAAIRKEAMRHSKIELTASTSYTTMWEDDLVRPLDALEQALIGRLSAGPATGPVSCRKESKVSGRAGNVRPVRGATTRKSPRPEAAPAAATRPATKKRRKA